MQKTLAQRVNKFVLRLARRMLWLLIPVIGLCVAMALHSALLTGVFELILIVVIGAWITSVFQHDTNFYSDDRKRSESSYLERDQEYLEEQMNISQQEHEEQHRV